LILRRVAIIALLLPVVALAAGEREKSRLASLREQRAALERQVREKEAARAAAAEQLRVIEKAIDASARKLHTLEEEAQNARAELARHTRELKRLENQAATRQAQLAKLLRSQFQPREPDALALWLAGDDPNAAARERYFLARLARAKAALIDQLRADAAQMRSQAELVREQSARLAVLVKSAEAERAQWQQRQKERQTLLAQLASQIQQERRTIETLKQDEQRLARVLARLEKQKAAAQKRPAPSARPSQPSDASRAVPPRAEPPEGSGAFARLRGRLPWPVQGQVAARFGARREEGALFWKGMFIRAPAGAEVRAVAAGVVAFADWLRGYGQLLIIDHDDGFLSIYGNNQSLLAQVGQQVDAGAPVATVGNSGGYAESGLYFELRHKGQAFDPGKWLAAR